MVVDRKILGGMLLASSLLLAVGTLGNHVLSISQEGSSATWGFLRMKICEENSCKTRSMGKDKRMTYITRSSFTLGALSASLSLLAGFLLLTVPPRRATRVMNRLLCAGLVLSILFAFYLHQFLSDSFDGMTVPGNPLGYGFYCLSGGIVLMIAASLLGRESPGEL